MEVVSLDSLPVGLRFRPTDVELIHFYLRSKINGNDDGVRIIREVDICKWEPWDLPDLSAIKTKDSEWLFFCPLDRKYPSGSRMNRATVAGYWKATGKDRNIKSGNNLIGFKRTLVFYTGRAPKGTRTCWIMHEYRATEKDLDGTKPGQSPFVICKLFNKQGENAEDSKCDEVESIVSSPTVDKSSAEEMKSELELSEVSPTLHIQPGKHPVNAESSIINISGSSSDTVAVAECHNDHSHACIADDQVAEVNPKLEDLDFFCDLPSESLDCELFSPLHSQMQAELVSSFNLLHSNNGDLFNNQVGMQVQCGTNDSDAYLSEFLDSILKNPNEFSTEIEIPKELALQSLSCSMLDAEQAQGQVDYGDPWMQQGTCLASFDTFDLYQEPTYSVSSTRRDESSGTGIMIRSRLQQTQPCNGNFAIQGDAPRRLLLQRKLCGQKFDLEHNEVMPDDKEVEATKETGKVNIKVHQGVRANTELRSKSMGLLYKRVASLTTCSCVKLLRVAVVAVVFLLSVCGLPA